MPGYSINDALDTDWDTLIKVISMDIDSDNETEQSGSPMPQKSQQKPMDLGDFIKSI
jgi:hypothetical protein